MDSLSLATVILALATIALAFFTYQAVNHGKNQTEMLVRQTMILRSQIDPIPHITEFSFSNNSLNLDVENIGSGPASSLAVETSFVPAKKVFYENEQSRKPLTGIELEKFIPSNNQITIRYEVYEKTLEKNGEKFNPIREAYILPNKKRNTLVLLPNETQSYNIELGFGFYNEKVTFDEISLRCEYAIF